MKFEIVVIPVTNVDSAKDFYGRLGWRLDADYDNGVDFRVILQFTPPGSAQGMYLIVSDIQAARTELVARGVNATEVFHDAGGVYAGPDEAPFLGGAGSAVRIPATAATAHSSPSATRRQRLAVAGSCRRRHYALVGGQTIAGSAA